MKNLNETTVNEAVVVMANDSLNTQETYVKPQMEVVELELEQAILGDSATAPDFGNGGRY